MQNQPKLPCAALYAPLCLPEEFPVEGIEGMHTPSGGEITLLHFHNCLEIGYCYEGAGLFIVDDKILPFSKGDVSCIFKNQVHIARSDGDRPSKWKFASVNPELLLSELHLEELSRIIAISKGNPDFCNILSGGDHPDLAQLADSIMTELEQTEDGYRSVVKALVWAFLIKLGRMMGERESSAAESCKTDIMRISPALAYIARSYSDPIHVGQLAALCSTSLTNFRRLFVHSMKVSPLEYMIRVRIQMAAILLSDSDESVLGVSLGVGFASLSSFNRHFKRLTGVSPREWRARRRV